MKALALGLLLCALPAPDAPLVWDGWITAYSSGTRTASGLPVSSGMAACPPWVTFHTLISIDGLGSYVCEDRGGAIVGTALDIYMPVYADAVTFGRQWHRWRLPWCSSRECAVEPAQPRIAS